MFYKYISMSLERLSSEQVVRNVGFDLKHKLRSIIMAWLDVWPGCEHECHMHLHQILIIYSKPCYKEDVCYTLFCLSKSDNIL